MMEKEDDWSLARHLYETTRRPISEIARKYALEPDAVRRRCADERWARPITRKRAKQVILDGLWRALAGQTQEVERAYSQLSPDRTSPTDKEATVLANLAKTMEKLIELEKVDAVEGPKVHTKDINTLRERLAYRIEQYLQD